MVRLVTELWRLNFIQGKFCLNNPHFRVKAQTVREQESRYSQRHFDRATIVRTLREEQPLRLLLNLLFYHFNRSEPTYKSQRIALLDVIAACNQLNVNALN